MKKYANHNTTAYSYPSDAFALEAYVRSRFSVDIDRISTLIAHPRSLARPLPTWRPPSVKLPALPHAAALTVSITRHRVGKKVRGYLRAYGESRTPAYLVSARFSSPSGCTVTDAETEAWLRATLPSDESYAVHELLGEAAPTYCWLVDQHFQPLDSPASLFNVGARAA